MRTKKTQSPPQSYSVNALSKLTGHDRRTIDKLVVGCDPVIVNGQKQYRLEDVQSAMASKPDKSLKEEKLEEEVRKLRINNDKSAGILVRKSDVAAAIRRALGQVAQISESRLVNEYPSAVAGLDSAQARIYGKRLHDSLMAECQKLAKEFPE